MEDIRSGSHRWSRVARRCVLLAVLAGGFLFAAPSPSQGAFPGANGLIAFVRGGRIWVTDTDGNASKLGRGDDPAWSPDGTRIAFDRNNAGTGNWHIWTMLADGSQVTRMTSGMGANIEPAWSPDGTELVFAHFGYGDDTDYDLFTIDASVSLAPATWTVRQRSHCRRWSFRHPPARLFAMTARNMLVNAFSLILSP